MIRIALIEDTSIHRYVIKSFLNDRYKKFIKIRDFSSASTFIKEDIKKFDLILTDYAMPGMSGIELKPYLKNKHIDIPIVLITGRNFKVEMTQAELDNVCDAFICRPFKTEDFYTTLDAYINALY